MRLGFITLLVGLSLPAYASGETGAVAAGLVPLLVLCATIVLVLLGKASWPRKLRALLPVAVALGAVIALGFVPDYERHANWLVPLCMAVACSGSALAWRSVRAAS